MQQQMQGRQYDFLKGGGEMGERVRQYNWGQTPVGSPDTWPAALRITVSTLLQSKFPMFLLWGPDYIQFYNDAYVPSFGTDGKHPKALGQRGEDCWREAWQLLGPLLDQVRLGGEAVWKEDQWVPMYRNGQVEDTYWTFSYSPVLNEDGSVGGVLSTCFETTQKVSTLEKLNENADELRFAIDANELGTWDLNPATGHFSANARLKEWFGLAPDEEIPLTLAISSMIETDRQRIADAIAKALDYNFGGHYEETYTIVNPTTGRRRIVLAKGRSWFGPDNKAYRFNGTLQDITEQRQAELNQQLLLERIEISRRQLLHSFEEAPVAIATIDREDLTFRMANRFYCELVGRTPEEIIDKPLMAALPELKGQGFDDLLQQVLDTGVPFISKEVAVDLLRNGELSTYYVDLSYQPQYLVEGSELATGILVVATDVTEQVLSRKTIMESVARFRSLVAEAPVATCLYTGREMRVEIANDIMLRYWGKNKNVLGLPLSEALPELEGQSFFPLLERVFTTGKEYTEHNAEAKLIVDGELQTFYFDYTYKPLHNIDGQVYGILNMAVDVTEQVLSRKKMEESERFVRHIFYNSPVAKLVYVGDDMIIREANEAMLQMFGRDESILHRPVMEAIPELQQTDLREKYLKVLTTGEAHYEHAQRILLVKDGKNNWGYYDYIYKPLLDADDNIYGVICTAVDITKEVTARQQIEEAEALLRDAIDLAELAMWTIDVPGKTIQYSDRLQDWLGITSAELQLSGSRQVHEKDRDRVGQAIGNALDANGPGRFDEIYTIVNAKTGQERIIHSTGRTTFDDNGKALYISGSSQDITLQQQLQIALQTEVKLRTEELEIINEDLRLSNEKLSQYAYIASHDLQEPLRKIRVFSGILQEQKEITGNSRNYVDKINRSAERMSQLIKDLLEFSRLPGAGQTKIPVDLNKVVREIHNDFELAIAEKKAVLEIGSLPTVDAMALQMNQLFYNLISNSLKFMAEGVTPVIKIEAAQLAAEDVQKYIRKPATGKNYYRISIRDNGVGFDQKYAEQIFELFKRLHKKDEYSGSGIGLSLCRRIVDNHGGYLYCDAAIGKGANFHIIIPQ